MRYENQKRLTLFSKDALRSNNTFKWNNIRDLGLLKDSTIQVSNFDVKSSSVEPVGPASTEYVSLPEDNSVSTDNLIAHLKFEEIAFLPDNLITHFRFDNNLTDSSGENSILNGISPVYSTIVKKGDAALGITTGKQFNLTKNGSNNVLGNLTQFMFLDKME